MTDTHDELQEAFPAEPPNDKMKAAYRQYRSRFDTANPVQVERDGDDIVLRVVTELLDESGSVRLNPMQQLSLFQAVDNARRGLLFNYHARV